MDLNSFRTHVAWNVRQCYSSASERIDTIFLILWTSTTAANNTFFSWLASVSRFPYCRRTKQLQSPCRLNIRIWLHSLSYRSRYDLRADRLRELTSILDSFARWAHLIRGGVAQGSVGQQATYYISSTFVDYIWTRRDRDRELMKKENSETSGVEFGWRLYTGHTAFCLSCTLPRALTFLGAVRSRRNNSRRKRVLNPTQLVPRNQRHCRVARFIGAAVGRPSTSHPQCRLKHGSRIRDHAEVSIFLLCIEFPKIN